MRITHRQIVRMGFSAIAVAIAVCSGTAPASARRSEPVPPHGEAARRAIAPPNEARVLGAYANLPVAFVENRGQVDARVRYYAQGPRYAFYLTHDDVVLSFLNQRGSDGVNLGLRFLGANPGAAIEGEARAAGDVNYLRGADAAGWQQQVPRYSGVVYRGLWPGVDLRLREQAGTLKYEFHLRPEARVADISLAYTGADGLEIDDAGRLLIGTAIGVLRDAAPMSYQMIDGVRVPVESRYLTRPGTDAAARFGFGVGAYDKARELVIDPGVEYSTFLGGASHEIPAGIRVDAQGNAYIVGTTQSPNFPTTAGAFRRSGAASNFGDVFVTKLNPSGTALVYSTFIGGSNFDWGRGIAIDAAGNAYVTGQTKSSNFPTTGGAFDRTFNIDNCPRCGVDQYDAFALKLNAAGSALVYSTFLGGFDIDDGMAIAVDTAGNAYIAGETGSTNFPLTAGAFDTTRNGSFDAFVTKLNPTGSALVYSTLLGGAGVEFPGHIALDAGRNLYVAGSTSSADFPTTAGAFDRTANGGFDAFVTKLNAAGSALVYSTFLGGADSDSAAGLAVDPSGSAYVAGSTASFDFPTTPGAFDTLANGSEAFVTKLNPAGSALIYSTLLGGSASESTSAVAVDGAGNAWVTGGTVSADFPMIVGAADSSFNGMSDAFVAELSADGSTLLYSTYLGGTQSDGGYDIALDASGGVYVTGLTYSIDFPTTAGAFDTVFNGDLLIFWGDGFVAKLGAVSAPPSTPAVPEAPTLIAPANGDNPPQPITFQWSVAAGAATYTIQIDDSSAFTAPLVREQQNISTLLMYATTGLSSTPHFWRVRGVNAAGVAGPWSAVRTLTPGPQPPPATLGSLDTNPSTVVGGNQSSGTAVLSVGAPFGGAQIALSSSNPAVAAVPATATAAATSFTALFTITTSPVSASTVVTITASYNGSTRTAALTVTPAVTPPLLSVQSLSIDPASVVGGAGAQGLVTLSGSAPQGGAVVSLWNENTAAASIPASVTVPAGSAAAAFSISTAAVSVSTPLSLLASYNGTNRSAVLTVTPPPPPQTAALTVAASGRGGERVSSSPAGINAATGSSGTASFASGTAITLSVSNGRDAIWSGACSSGGSKKKSCTFTITGTATVTANVQ